MKYWLDTEFIEDGHTIDLISIGIVAEDGREYYAQNHDCDLRKASDWVKANVLPHLDHPTCAPSVSAFACRAPDDPEQRGGGHVWKYRKHIRDDVRTFLNVAAYGKPEFWGYFADYDWVVFCQLFGRMVDLPPAYPRYCRDIKQWCDDLGNPRLPEQGKGEHHALADARWNRTAWDFLASLPAAAGAVR